MNFAEYGQILKLLLAKNIQADCIRRDTDEGFNLFFLIIAVHDGFVYSWVAMLIKWNILRFTGLIQEHQSSSVLNQITLICYYY